MNIRPAQPQDQPTIVRIVRDAKINPLSIAWSRFLVAEEAGQIVGVGQIKPHGDASRELASIAVVPSYRGRGIAGQIIRRLLERESGVLYLTCRDPLESFYVRFGFRRIGREEMSPYFRRVIRVANLWMALIHSPVRIIVMKRNISALAAGR
jgi:N-acetylglutamate synthase-like GNAT family acetyltransferase